MTTNGTTYRIAPISRADFDLAGEGNEFTDFSDAFAAACSMDRSNPLPDGDGWIIYERTDGGGWRRV